MKSLQKVNITKLMENISQQSFFQQSGIFQFAKSSLMVDFQLWEVTSVIKCILLRLFIKEYLTKWYKFCIDW